RPFGCDSLHQLMQGGTRLAFEAHRTRKAVGVEVAGPVDPSEGGADGRGGAALLVLTSIDLGDSGGQRTLGLLARVERCGILLDQPVNDLLKRQRGMGKADDLVGGEWIRRPCRQPQSSQCSYELF